MSKRVLCKFFAHGTCLKGEHCEFSHDWKDPPNNICTFYQRGICSYGSHCRYEHVKVSRPVSTASSSSTVPHQSLVHPARTGSNMVAAFGETFCFSTCGKHCLHPFIPEERDEHLKSCEKKHKHLEVLKHSQEIECSVCLDRVFSKPTAAERKFGLLSECDHPFCISCIRNWRSSSPSFGMDVNTALRTCPICRKISYFVVPSVIWYSAKEEKQEIIDDYKANLRSIDCKHFDFGNGNCPFGTSCFYKHAYQDGHPEEVVVRHLGLIAKNNRCRAGGDSNHWKVEGMPAHKEICIFNIRLAERDNNSKKRSQKHGIKNT